MDRTASANPSQPVSREREKAKQQVLPQFRVVEDELLQVENKLYDILESESQFLESVSTHLLAGGGKRVRPALVLLASHLEGHSPAHVVPVAAAVELVHMATLIHDDVVDEGLVRRGLPTVNQRWNEQVSVLTGDFLFAHAFAVFAAAGDPRITQIMARVVVEMSKGEIDQLSGVYDGVADNNHYWQRIEQKTGYFIQESCRLGAVLAGLPQEQEEALAAYGSSIGTSFQIVDDILDLAADSAQLGKVIGADLRAGVITMPVIFGLEQSDQPQAIRRLIQKSDLSNDDIEQMRSLLRQCGAFEYCYQRAVSLAAEAKAQLGVFSDSPYRDALCEVADFIVERSF